MTFTDNSLELSVLSLFYSIVMQTKKQFSKEKPYYLDICEHRALRIDEHLSNICVSYIESSSIVYIMTIEDHKRAMQLLEAMKKIETMNENDEALK